MSNDIFHVITFHTLPRAPYTICNYSTTIFYNKYTSRPYVLLHIIPTLFLLVPPPIFVMTLIFVNVYFISSF